MLLKATSLTATTMKAMKMRTRVVEESTPYRSVEERGDKVEEEEEDIDQVFERRGTTGCLQFIIQVCIYVLRPVSTIIVLMIIASLF